MKKLYNLYASLYNTFYNCRFSEYACAKHSSLTQDSIGFLFICIIKRWLPAKQTHLKVTTFSFRISNRLTGVKLQIISKT